MAPLPDADKVWCEPSAKLFCAAGAAGALIFANMGASYGTAKSAIGIAHLGIMAPAKIMRGIVPVVMAGILGIYGLIVAVIVQGNLNDDYPNTAGYMEFAGGLAAGFASLAAGLAIGVVGDNCARAYGKQDKIFVAMILMLIFAEALGLYGLIVALLMNTTAQKLKGGQGNCKPAIPGLVH